MSDVVGLFHSLNICKANAKKYINGDDHLWSPIEDGFAALDKALVYALGQKTTVRAECNKCHHQGYLLELNRGGQGEPKMLWFVCEGCLEIFYEEIT